MIFPYFLSGHRQIQLPVTSCQLRNKENFPFFLSGNRPLASGLFHELIHEIIHEIFLSAAQAQPATRN
jgi:hypothetical protein